MTLRDPWVLLTLVPLAVALFWIVRQGLKRRASIRFSSLVALEMKSTPWTVVAAHALPWVRALGLGLLLFALARPQVITREEKIETEGIDIMLGLDISGSMQAEDFKPQNRLRVAKDVVKEFLGLVKNDRVGLVVFSGQAFTQCPLTLDYAILQNLVENVQIGMIQDGTAIGTALANCVGRLKDSAAKSKVVILLTDGENNAGQVDPETASKIAAAFDVRVYTIGVGKEGGAPIPVDHPVYGKIYARNPDGSLILTKIDEKSLKKIAETTGGQYFRATDEEALSKIYRQVLELERTKFQVKRYEHVRELYRWAAIPAGVLLLLEILFARTRLRVLP